jgi:hypothetical protein
MLAATTGNETVGDLWYWPNGLYMLIPVLLVWLLWFILFLEHLFNLASAHDVSIRYQALFTRIILIFPLMATFTYIAAGFPWSADWINFLSALFEVYCITAFFALLSGLGHIFFPTKQQFESEMLKSFWTKGPFLKFGPDFENGEKSFGYFKWLVYQCIIIKPLAALVFAIVTSVLGKVNRAAQITTRFISALSLIIAISSILRVYRFLTDTPGAPLQGHNVLWKFVVIKVLFVFVILNGIFLEPMISSNVIPIDDWLCTNFVLALPEGKDFCQIRLASVIFIFEILVVIVPACLSYRHHGLRRLKMKTKGQNVRHFLYYTAVYIFDLHDFIEGEIVNGELKETATMDEKERFLAETIMEEE